MPDNQSDLQKRRELLALLNSLENALHKQGLWQTTKPSEAALSSILPFAIDSLTFDQWLQFIFINKMGLLLQSSQPLPSAISVLPMATEYFKSLTINSVAIIDIIGRIDFLISDNCK